MRLISQTSRQRALPPAKLTDKEPSTDSFRQTTRQACAKRQTVAAAKRAVHQGSQLPLIDGLQLEARLVDELYDTKDAKEGFAAAAEKRAPDFRSR